MADETDTGRNGPPQGAIIAVLLLALAVAVAWRVLRGRHAWDPVLNRAAHALVEGQDRPLEEVTVRGPSGVMSVPARPRLDRAGAVRLALELDRLRPSAPPAREQADAARASTLLMRGRMRGVLKTGPAEAQVVLYGLGWPWVDFASDLPGAEHGVTAPPAGALEVRKTLQDVFLSRSGAQEAREALGRHAALAPFQVEAVLAMRGALELLHATQAAEAALASVAAAHPELAGPIIEERRRAGVDGAPP